MFSGIEITSLYLLLINADLGVDETGKGLIMRASFAETTLCVRRSKMVTRQARTGPKALGVPR